MEQHATGLSLTELLEHAPDARNPNFAVMGVNRVGGVHQEARNVSVRQSCPV
jgi:hypothetical protein